MYRENTGQCSEIILLIVRGFIWVNFVHVTLYNEFLSKCADKIPIGINSLYTDDLAKTSSFAINLSCSHLKISFSSLIIVSNIVS